LTCNRRNPRDVARLLPVLQRHSLWRDVMTKAGHRLCDESQVYHYIYMCAPNLNSEFWKNDATQRANGSNPASPCSLRPSKIIEAPGNNLLHLGLPRLSACVLLDLGHIINAFFARIPQSTGVRSILSAVKCRAYLLIVTSSWRAISSPPFPSPFGVIRINCLPTERRAALIYNL